MCTPRRQPHVHVHAACPTDTTRPPLCRPASEIKRGALWRAKGRRDNHSHSLCRRGGNCAARCTPVHGIDAPCPRTHFAAGTCTTAIRYVVARPHEPPPPVFSHYLPRGGGWRGLIGLKRAALREGLRACVTCSAAVPGEVAPASSLCLSAVRNPPHKPCRVISRIALASYDVLAAQRGRRCTASKRPSDTHH